MAFIKGKQLADQAITPAKVDFTGGTFNFSQGATLQASSPSNNADVATKAYVDAANTSSAAGLDFKESAFVATTANLAATYNANVLTASANGAISIDGESLSLDQRVLVKDQSTASHNGLFTVSAVGDASNPFTLTRAADADSSDDLTTGAFIFIEAGTDNQNKAFVLQANNDGTSPTLDTDDLTFIQFSGAGQIEAGEGLTKSGDTLNAALPQVDSGSVLVTLSSDGSATGISISATPSSDSHVRVTVNGVGIELGDGVTTKDAYFDDGASGARAIADIASGDELIWNGAVAYSLESSDIVEIFYHA